MASSRGGPSDLRATTDARAVMFEQQLANADETEAMEIDQEPSSSVATQRRTSGNWLESSISSVPAPSDHLQNLRHQGPNLVLYPSSFASHFPREQSSEASASVPDQPSSSMAVASTFPHLASQELTYGPSGRGGDAAAFRTGDLRTGDLGHGAADAGGCSGSAATVASLRFAVPPAAEQVAGPSLSAPPPPSLLTQPAAVDVLCRGSGRGDIATGGEAGRRWPHAYNGMELTSDNSREIVDSGNIGAANGGSSGVEEDGATTVRCLADGTAAWGGAASASATATAVRPICPYIEYDPYVAAQAPLASFYSYAVTEELDDDDEDDDDEEEDEAVAAAATGVEDWEDEEEGGAGPEEEEQDEAETEEARLANAETDMDYGVLPGTAAAAAAAAAATAAAAAAKAAEAVSAAAAAVAAGGGSLHLHPRRQGASDSLSEGAAALTADGSGAAAVYDSTDTTEMDDIEVGSEEDDDDRLLDGTAEGGGGGRAAAAAVAAGSDEEHRRANPNPAPVYGGALARLRHPLLGADHHRHSHTALAQRLRPLYAKWLEGSRFRTKTNAGKRSYGGSGAASASVAGPSMAALRGTNSGVGPSGSGDAAAAAAGEGAAGGWSLRYRVGPEFVSADPWSDDEEEETDTTAEQFYAATHPKDIQGIPWERLQFNRSTYRETRLRQYRNYTNVLPDNTGGAYRAELAPLCVVPRRCGTAGITTAAAGGGDNANGSNGGAAARGPPFFTFVRNSRAVQSNIVHFQLRNLVWATSPNDVFVVHDNCVNHWNPAARAITEVMNLGGGGGGGAAGGSGRAGDDSSRIQALGRVQVSTLCVSGDLVAAGGFMGELVVKRLDGLASAGERAEMAAAGRSGMRFRPPPPPPPPAARAAAAAAAPGAGADAHAAGTRRGGGGGAFLARGGAGDLGPRPGSHARGGGKAGGAGSLLYCGRITSSDNGITNGLEIFNDRTHGTVIMSANNDQMLRLFAASPGEGSLRPLAQWPFDWAVNYATVRPDSHMAAVVGDDSDTLLTDIHNGATVARLHGHQDFSFAAAWHPGGTLLATGNQDTTTLLWDVRKTQEPLTRLAGRMGAVRSLRFTPDGRFLAMSEPADFVHVYDVASGFQDCQEHDFFGEIAGIAFTPDSSNLFVGISDLTYASLMHLERQRCDWW